MTEKRWRIVCTNFASAAFDSQSDAQIHLGIIRAHTCKQVHRVEYTELPYGTRHVGKAAS